VWHWLATWGTDEERPAPAVPRLIVTARAVCDLRALPPLPRPQVAGRRVALYRHEPAEDAVYVLAFRHQRGAGFA
jgi:hypothetical protein